MNNNPVLKLQRNITRRYVLALAIIAILSSGAFYILVTALQGSEDSAYVVNISGKQRMLSQTIALDVFRLYQLRTQSYYQDPLATEHQVQQVIKRLHANIAEMEAVNELLSTGQTSQDLSEPPHPISDELTQLYFGETNLAQEVREYLVKTKMFMQEAKPTQQGWQEISYMAPQLLAKLHQAVEIYQKEGEQQLDLILQVEVYVWIVTLFMLLLEVIFIFQPMVKQIVFLARENQLNMKNLEQKVKLRTLSLEKANATLQRLATLDPLTGLYNRLNLEKDIEQQLLQAQQHHAPFAVFMLDIDHFKKVNDEYGHDVGDFVLSELAKLLQSLVRNGDSVYRAGGEEFVVLLSRISFKDATKKVEKIRLAVAEYPFQFKEFLIHKTLSIGLYHSSIGSVEGVKDLLKKVDSALYESKANGRNKITQVLINQENTV